MSATMAKHEQSKGKTDEWYTPPHVFDALGCEFTMDVSSPGQCHTPWIPAEDFLVFKSLERGWRGFIWMNPPFGGRNGLVPWLYKFFSHGNGIALVPDRTSAPWWQEYAPRADLALFISPKLRFIGGQEAADLGLVDKVGDQGKSPAQGTTLLASGPRAVEALKVAAKRGLGSLFAPLTPSACQTSEDK
jgi:hypothetical protein